MILNYSQTDGIGWLTLSNPPYNALTSPVFADYEELSTFLRTPSLKAVVLRGEGKHFSSGADLKMLNRDFHTPEALGLQLSQGKKLLECLTFAAIPVFALIRGSCLGAGLEIALACHFRFSSRNAMLGFPECQHGVMPGLGGTILAQELMPRRQLIELVLSGQMIQAREACRLGLVDHIAPARDIEPQLLAFIHSLLDKRSPHLIRTIMTSIHNGRRMSRPDALREETKLFVSLIRQINTNTDQP